MAGVIWVGADGNYYAKASDFEGVKNVTNVVNDPTNPWMNIINGYDRIDDPNPPQKQPPKNTRQVATDPSAQEKADEMAYWDDQLSNADQQLARVPEQERILRDNAASSYQSAYERLVGDKNTTERDFTTTKTRAVEDNVTAKNNINASVRNQNAGLQRLLGSRGAGNSSAAQILAPFAAAKVGNQQRQQVQTAYGRNMQGLDTAWGDYEKDWEESAGDLATQRDNAINQGVAGLRQTEADLLEAKSNAAVQRNQAGGQSYTQARSARQPYSERIKALIGQIDAAGATKNFTPKTAAYKAPEMSQYTYDRYGAPQMGSNVNPGQAQQAGAYWTLLGKEDDKKRPTAQEGLTNG